MSSDLPRGTSPPAGGLAATDLADWLTVDVAAAAIGCSKRTMERRSSEWSIEERLRPQAGSRAIAVYNPDDVARKAQDERAAPAPWVLPAGTTHHSNGNGQKHEKFHTSTKIVRAGDDPIRQLAAAFERFLLSPPSPPVAEKVAETLYVTVAEAAAILGLPQADVQRLCHDGDLNHRLTGRGGIRIRRKDLEAL